MRRVRRAALLGLLAQLVPRGHKAVLGLPGPAVRQAQRARAGPQESLERPALLEQRVRPGPQAQAQLGRLVPQGP